VGSGNWKSSAADGSQSDWRHDQTVSKTNLDFTEARDSEWQWHQLGDKQVCTSLMGVRA